MITRAAVEPLVLPVGHDTGVFPAEDDPEQPDHHQVRRGDELIGLPEPAYAVWSLCHGRANQHDQPADRRWTRRAVQAIAERDGIGQARTLIRQLTDDDLATEVVPGSKQGIWVAEAYRIAPTLLGLGNTAEDPGTYTIGRFGTPVLRVSRNLYEVWRWSPVSHSLWDACQRFAAEERVNGETDPASANPEMVLAGVLDNLHGLLAGGAAYLDLAA